MKKKSIIGAALIMSGALAAGYPWLSAWRYECAKRKMLEQWVEISEPNETLPLEAAEPFDGVETVVAWALSETEEDIVYDVSYSLDQMVGVISIDKINVYIPILGSLSTQNLNRAVCVVEGSPPMGGEGNYCLAGHRSRVYGRHFNRLNELTQGDTVTLSDNNADYVFEVKDILLVTPEDNWVMADTPGKTELTLITCDYTTKETGRLIVRCELNQ